jgi:hypothetical protein
MDYWMKDGDHEAEVEAFTSLPGSEAELLAGPCALIDPNLRGFRMTVVATRGSAVARALAAAGFTRMGREKFLFALAQRFTT